ncbi:hypothetical protein TNIN_176081 [Trichonephila inaurata madagascariensis]|uniref:Uncharacterized protein n=1 Tax=Trichonephila inaurata madagascariensis TaxID=2747483 RepID=A0A8X6XYU8_9ARAC|nr:hypothetical protein TNIN_176081 [Trichonephila inaurata madagascariensis]
MVVEVCMHRNAVHIVEKALNLPSIPLLEGMRDSKGSIMSSTLNKMMEKFEAAVSLASRQRNGRPSAATSVPTKWRTATSRW